MRKDLTKCLRSLEDDMSYRAEIVGQYHTVADEIFCDVMIKKYEAGEEFYVELYNETNRLFPGERRDLIDSRSESVR